MKIPDIFIPEKNLDEKTKELKGYENALSAELTLEGLMKNNMRILYGGAKEDQQDEILRNAIDKIVNDTFKNKIGWEKDPDNYPNISESYKAKATILNYEGKKITIPIMFQVDDDPDFRWGYLYLGGKEGDKEGLCRNINDEKVKELTVKYFKIKMWRN